MLVETFKQAIKKLCYPNDTLPLVDLGAVAGGRPPFLNRSCPWPFLERNHDEFQMTDPDAGCVTALPTVSLHYYQLTYLVFLFFFRNPK